MRGLSDNIPTEPHIRKIRQNLLPFGPMIKRISDIVQRSLFSAFSAFTILQKKITIINYHKWSIILRPLVQFRSGQVRRAENENRVNAINAGRSLNTGRSPNSESFRYLGIFRCLVLFRHLVHLPYSRHIEFLAEATNSFQCQSKGRKAAHHCAER